MPMPTGMPMPKAGLSSSSLLHKIFGGQSSPPPPPFLLILICIIASHRGPAIHSFLDPIQSQSQSKRLDHDDHPKMNLALIDPFQLAQDHPDTLTHVLRMEYSPSPTYVLLLILISRKWPCNLA